jgi:hypothetical protein
MEIIAFVESDDCGPAAIIDSDFISIMQFADFYIGATRCIFRDTPITCELTPEIAHKLMKKGVKCLNFETHK